MSTIRVLLADDHALVRAGFRVILDASPGIEVVGEAATGEQAVAQTAALAPDVVCMDVQMPGMDGLEATRRILAAGPDAPAIVVLTTFDREDYLFQALEAGASGFLLKNTSPEDLVAAVRVIAAGEALLSPEVTRRVIGRFAGAAASPAAAAAPTTGPEYEELTEREAEVLGLVARGMSNAEIAAALWVGDATVKSHVSRVLAKLGLRDRIQAVVYAYEHGLAGRAG